jgi:hypothetical protein
MLGVLAFLIRIHISVLHEDVVGTRHRQRKRLRRRQCCTNQGYEAGGAEGIKPRSMLCMHVTQSNVIQYNVM